MKAAIILGIGVCLFVWASDGLSQKPSKLSDIFISVWLVLIAAVAVAG